MQEEKILVKKKMKISKTKIHFVTAGRNIVFSLEWYFFNFVWMSQIPPTWSLRNIMFTKNYFKFNNCEEILKA